MVKKNEWFPKGNIELEKSALETIKYEGNGLVIAGPGAGKTELLAQKVDYLFSTNTCFFPKKILALSFKVDAASNLKDRVRKSYGEEYASRFISLTYSAFEKKILDQFRSVLPVNDRPSEDYLIEDWDVIKQIFAEKQLSSFSNLRAKEFTQLVENIVLNENCEDKFKEIKKCLLNGTQNSKGVLLYKQINKLATEIVSKNVYVRRALQMTYGYIFLDEFQDTTLEQYELVKSCFLHPSCKITAVGDDKQAIMKWAGADAEIFSKFIKDFKAEQYKLIINHRSVPKLVEFQKEFYQLLNSNPNHIQYDAKKTFTKGEITLFEFDNETIEANVIVKDIVSKIDRNFCMNEICILVKQKVESFSSELITKLKDNAIKARIENEYQEILKDPTCNLVLDLILCSQGGRYPSIWDNISNFYRNINGIDEDTNQLVFESHYREIDSLICSVSCWLQKNISDEKGMLHLIASIVEMLGSEKIIDYFSRYKGKGEFQKTIDKFSKMLYIEYSEANGNWKEIVPNFRGEHSIPIMTVHKSKGLEFRAVYFIGLEDSAFWNFDSQQEEDIKTFFVAISRARTDLIFTHCKCRKNYPQKRDKISLIYQFLESSDLVEKIKIN